MHEFLELGLVVILWVLIGLIVSPLALVVVRLLRLQELFLIELRVQHLLLDELSLDLLRGHGLSRCADNVLVGLLLLLLRLSREEVGLIARGEDHAPEDVPAPLP